MSIMNNFFHNKQFYMVEWLHASW